MLLKKHFGILDNQKTNRVFKMKVREYIKVNRTDEGFGFTILKNNAELDCYLASDEYKRDSYELKYSSMIIIYKADLIESDVEKIRTIIQENYL